MPVSLPLSGLHDGADMKVKPRPPHILYFCLACCVASSSSEESEVRTRSLKSYTMSRLTFSYDAATESSSSHWWAAPFAEGAAAVPVEGSLVLPAPESSCQRQPAQSDLSLSLPVIVLVRRGECSFDEKVVNVKHLSNLTGVIIYNDREEKDLSNIYVNKTSLPVIFTSLSIGENLTDILRRGGQVNVSVSVDSVCQQEDGSAEFQCVRAGGTESSVTHWDIVCMAVAVFILASLSLASFMFYYLKRLTRVEKLEQHERKKELLVRKALSQLEVRRVEEGHSEGSDTCSICLEVMRAGQVTSRLPCRHSYHKKCIDTWLVHRRKCPLCKLDILKYFREQLKDSDTE